MIFASFHPGKEGYKKQPFTFLLSFRKITLRVFIKVKKKSYPPLFLSFRKAQSNALFKILPNHSSK